MNKSCLLMIGTLAAVAMISAEVISVNIQQVSAYGGYSGEVHRVDIEQTQSNYCSESYECSNSASVVDTYTGDTNTGQSCNDASRCNSGQTDVNGPNNARDFISDYKHTIGSQ